MCPPFPFNARDFCFTCGNYRCFETMPPVRMQRTRKRQNERKAGRNGYQKKERKKAGLTQEDFAIRSGLGLRFVRELEQGKETVRLDKVNQALAMFGKEAVPGKKED